MTIRTKTLLFGALCTCFVFAIWAVAYAPPLGVDGPVTILRILNFASKWQVLFAAGVALIAATIAYLGATEKVRSDEKSALRAERLRLRGIFLRLQYTVHAIENEAIFFLNELNGEPTLSGKLEKIVNINFAEEGGISEAWQALDLMREDFADALFNIRVCFHNISDSKDHLAGKQALKPTENTTRASVHNVAFGLDRLVKISRELTATLRTDTPLH